MAEFYKGYSEISEWYTRTYTLIHMNSRVIKENIRNYQDYYNNFH